MVVEVTGLWKTYNPIAANAVTVLRGVDLEVRGGEFVALIGQSGSGKSTLLNILGALDVPTAGTVRIAGVDIAKLSRDGLADLRGDTIGFVFQFHYLLDEFTCLENALMSVAIRKGTPSPADVTRVQELMRRVGLEGQLHKRPTQISGGQQQRVAIVRALANRPRLILADEPTGNLDAHSGAEVFALMREVAREQQVAFVMVTHDDRLARAADRILRVEAGRVLPAEERK